MQSQPVVSALEINNEPNSTQASTQENQTTLSSVRHLYQQSSTAAEFDRQALPQVRSQRPSLYNTTTTTTRPPLGFSMPNS